MRMTNRTHRLLALTTAALACLTTLVAAPPATAAPPACPQPASGALRAAPGGGKTVALTFDDGPGPETPKVLEILRRHHVRATFFELGSQAQIWPEYARAVVADGHLLADHSYDHPNFSHLSPSAQAAQISRAADTLQRITGVRPCWFRPPFGATNSATVRVAKNARMSTVLWNVDTNDWAAGKTLNTRGEQMIRTNARAGGRLTHPMILMHDGGHQRPNMLHELDGIITFYQQRGYTFVGVDGRAGIHPVANPSRDYLRTPVGRTETFSAGAGALTVTGWTYDPDAPTTALTVRVQVDNRWVATTRANRARPRVTGTGAHSGFALRVVARRGSHVVCVFADNVGPGATAGLGCDTVKVR